MIRVRPRRIVLALLIAALAPSLVFADGSFARWRLLFKGEDGSKAYYYAASIKAVHHFKTGQLLGYSVWAGWENGDGSYNKGRYTIYCSSGDYTLDGVVQGSKDGKEEPAQGVGLEQPYQPESFVWWLADAVCAHAK